MRNAKKTLSLVMIAIFTTFIVLSGIPAGAVTATAAKAQVSKATAAVVKVEKTVKVSAFNVTTAQTQYTAATKEVAKVKSLGKTYAKTYAGLNLRTAAVAKKIAARKLAIAKAAAALTKAFADADKAVAALEDAVNPDNYDLVGNPADLAAAQGAVTAALEKIEALDKDSANYKGLMARVDIANGAVVKAMEEIAANEAAAEAEKAAKEAEAAAITAAETAVKAVEAAPLATMADVTAALELGKVAAEKVAAVKTAEKVTEFTARLKAVADKGAAVVVSLTPAVIKTVAAVDGTITVTFDKAPITTVAAADFTVSKTITTAAAATTTVVPTAVTTAGAVVTLTVPAVAATTTDQAVVYSVVYKATGAAIAAPAYTVAKSMLTATLSANNYKTAYVTFNKPVDADTITAANVKVYLGTNTTASVVDTDVTYVMSEDNKTLSMVFTNGLLSANKTIKVVIDGVASEANAADKITASTSTVVVNDLTIPTLTSAVAKNVKTLVLTFNEPIANGTTTFAQILSNIKVDGISVIGLVTADYAENTLTVALASAMTAGNHVVTTTGLKDFAGYAVVDTTNTVTAVADTTLPAVTSATVVDRNTISLTFNKELATLGSYTVNGASVTAAAGSTANIVKLTGFTLGLDAIVEIVVTYNGAADVVGNTVSTKTTYTFKTADDTTLPTVTAALDGTDTINQVTLTFSKPMQPGVGTFTIISSTGTVSAPIAIPTKLSGAWNTSNTTVKLSPALLGWATASAASYTLDIVGMKDNSIRQNAMLESKLAVTTVDAKVPTVLSIIQKAGATGYKTYTIYFSEAMDTAALTNESNYGLTIGGNVSPLSIIADASVSSIATDKKSVILTIPDTSAVTAITLYAVTDLAGNKLAVAPTAVGAAPAVTVSSVTAVSASTIKIKFNAPLATFDPSAFKVQVGTTDTFVFSGAALSTTTVTNDTLTLTVNGSLKANAGIYTVVPTTNYALITNIYGTAMLDTVAMPANVTDLIAPTVSSVVAGDVLDTTATTATPNTFSVTFTEALGGGVTTANVANEVVVKDADGNILSASDFTVTTTDNKTYKFVIDAAADDVSTGVNNYTVSIPVPRTLVDVAGNLLNVYSGSAITVTVQ